jgi:biotin transport system substrate-specific component
MPRTATPETFVHALGVRSRSSTLALAVKAAAVLFMTALTAAAAQVSFSIPFTTVPFTMQPMVVLMAGLALGPRLGMASQVLYLAAGFAGFPVFALSATLPMGAARLLGPTGGYLMAYPAAAFVAGWLATRGFDRPLGNLRLEKTARKLCSKNLGVHHIFVSSAACNSHIRTCFDIHREI